MTISGQQMLEGLAQARAFFKQVSLMLRTAEDLLYEAGLESICGNKTSNITSHLHKAEGWIPQDIYRFYVESTEEERGNKGLVTFIGVLLDREGAWAGFREPWVTCGIYQFSREQDPKSFHYWEWVTAALDDEHEPDGSFHDHQCTEEEQQEDNLLYQAVMALPLVEISDAESLKRRIVDPLLKKIEEIPGQEETD